MKILIGSDVCPINRNESVLVEGKLTEITVSALKGYDLFLANLECPLTEMPKLRNKYGESFCSRPQTLYGLKKMGITHFSLANNHIMDYGNEGLCSTISALEHYGFRWFGAGKNLEAASRPLFVQHEDTSVALLAFSEPFFASATRTQSGANLFDVPHIVRSFIQLPKDAFRIILLHGGNEHCFLPNPMIRDTSRMLAEMGADLIIVQHSHCIAGYEEWKNSLIFYGQGNFIFDYSPVSPSWFQGFLLEITISKNQRKHYRILPFVQKPGQDILNFLQAKEEQPFYEMMEKYNTILREEECYEKEWDRFCEQLRRDYQSILFEHGSFLYKMNHKFGFSTRFVNREKEMLLGRTLRCPSHLEVLKTLYSIEKTTK